MTAVPLSLKLLVPGYRARWRRAYACMLAELERLAPRLIYGEDGGIPWIDIDGEIRLFGFPTEPANAEVWRLLHHHLPSDIPIGHFRLVKDVLTRYVYPHMRPDLKPEGFAAEQMFGFHGQHKDAIADLADPASRERLAELYRPKDGEVFIDCGAFLGFGEVRLSRTISRGRFVAVEADRDCAGLLARNVEHNRAPDVAVMHRAVWNTETRLELETGFAQANTLISEVSRGQSRQPVQTVTIDQIVDGQGLGTVDMLSLTLNGAEVEALDGAAETLARLRPRIRLAGWYTRDGKKIWQITKGQLEAHDYTVFVGSRGNVLAVPTERLR